MPNTEADQLVTADWMIEQMGGKTLPDATAGKVIKDAMRAVRLDPTTEETPDEPEQGG